MSKIYRYLAKSENPIASRVRSLYRGIKSFTLPAPKIIIKPILWLFLSLRFIVHMFRRIFVAEPLFKAYCHQYGSGLHTGIYIHWIQGKGDIICGKNVHMDGKSSIKFAARYVDNPILKIGDSTGISHNCTLTIGKEISIGSNCRIASNVFIFDSSGHAGDPVSRREGAPPEDSEVKPVKIDDNVWIGRNCIVYPGVRIGENSIVSSGSVVMTDISPNVVVAGNPARKIGSLAT